MRGTSGRSVDDGSPSGFKAFVVCRHDLWLVSSDLLSCHGGGGADLRSMPFSLMKKFSGW
jgi:hypothetical protein